MGIVSSAKYGKALIAAKSVPFQSPMGIVSSAKKTYDRSRNFLKVSIPDGDSFLREVGLDLQELAFEALVSIPDGDSFLREVIRQAGQTVDLIVSIPDGDSFLREAVRLEAASTGQTAFQSPMGIVSSAKF